MSTPTISAAETLTSAFDSALHTLKHGRSYLAQFIADAQDARLERDEALKAMYASQKDEKHWKEQAASCKVALGKADATIKYHEITITQLQRESTQWKDQSRNWQEHFLRVEQERCRLSTLLEELLGENQDDGSSRVITTAPLTPSARRQEAT